jgi:nicotinamide mononucleotide transporter
MIDEVILWLEANWVEVVGAIFGIIYVWFSIKQSILTWPLGLITSILYIYVFFVSKFYADMALQFYYVWISIYGWILWQKGSTKHHKAEVKVTRVTNRLYLFLTVAFILIYIPIYIILKYYTDSPVPIGDTFTTALSIVATWMLARKYIEHWILWIVVDAVSMALYLYKGLYLTTALFAVYIFAAIWGYYEWRKELKVQL